MSDHILVNFETVHHAAEEVRASAGRIDQLLNDLKGNVTRIASSWQGVAQEGYQAHQKIWDDRAKDLQQVCSQIATSLDNAAQSYKTTEDNNAKLWQH
ncbi:WXG100 family type VII secretion target [Streptomyces sp. 1114.5]|uniref:WXG100 family type VII secretion target n=1 Tax=unclassified Streptomyces TaxID=2593676 RepID=UPI000BCFD6AD|nr:MULTISPECIES: WXG100 family type VII secretion target [unclassified Streptomyces]RKT17885.1 WXG100 family type VII secretion target [Streptomyces sp. 1114.5]SOB84092.1 WXG100 family type VII secretion target [Streptomyces sp. 1331.2]